MKKERLVYLLERVVTDDASEAEYTEMLELVTSPSNELEAKNELYQAYINAQNLSDISLEKRKQILTAIFQSEESEKTSRKPLNLFPRLITAAAILVVCVSVGWYFIKNSGADKKQTVLAAKDDVLPGGNRATLTLANGSTISLTDATDGEIANEAGIVISKQTDGQLLYEVTNTAEANVNGSNSFSTPYGGKYEIVLQDGTHVFLNSGSKITYPLSFGKADRTVELTGEAYFEVSKDVRRPFIVNTPGVNGKPGQEIRVLGTHFNLNAYEDEASYITTLVEGSVRVTSVNSSEPKLLKPGQQSIIGQQPIKVREANVDAVLAWKNDVFYFVDLPLKDMMRQLARWYDIEVVYGEQIPSIGFWAQLSRNKKLSENLESIQETNGVHFRIEGKTVFVTK